MINYIRRLAAVTPIRVLNDLRDGGVLTPQSVKAWDDIRHAVMHGELISPWSTGEEEDSRLRDLAELVHRITGEILAKPQMMQ